MKKIKILFVDHRFENRVGIESPLFFCNGLYQLKAYLETCEDLAPAIDMKIVTFEGLPFLQRGSTDEDNLNILRSLFAEQPDVLAFGLYVWNSAPLHELAGLVKRMAPSLLLVAGGPEVYDRQDFCHTFPHFDVLIEGDGELPLRDVLTRLAQGSRDFGSIANVSFRGAHDMVHNESAARFCDLNEIPNVYARHRDLLVGTGFYLTTRGCGHHCDYCLWARQPMRQKRPERVLEELQTLIGSTQLSHLTLFDYDLFEIYRSDPQLFAAIAALVARRGPDFDLNLFTNPGHMRDERLRELIRTLRLRRIIVGLQSCNPAALKAVNRGWATQSLDVFEHVDEDLRPFFFVELVYPLPEETPQSFIDTLKRLWSLGYFRLRVFHLMVLRGTRIRKNHESLGIRFVDWPPYFCYETPTSSISDTLRVGVLSYLVTLLATVLDGVVEPARAMQFFRTNPGLVDRLLEQIDAREHPDAIVRQVVREIVGIDYPGGFCNGEHKGSRQRVPSLAEQVRSAAAAVPTQDAQRRPTPAGDQPPAIPETDRLRRFFAERQFEWRGAKRTEDGVTIELGGPAGLLRIFLYSEKTLRPYFKPAGRYKVAYSGGAESVAVVEAFVDFLCQLQRGERRGRRAGSSASH